MIKKFRKSRIIFQLLCIMTGYAILIIALTSLTAYALFNYIIEWIATQSLDILLNKQLSRNLNRIYNIQARAMKVQFLEIQANLDLTTSLYQFSQKAQFSQNVSQCLQIQPQLDPIEFESQFCFGLYGDDSEYADLMKLANLMTEVLLVLSVHRRYYISVDSDSFMAYWQAALVPNYVPKSRVWYINHMNHLQEQYVHTDPYIGYFSYIAITFTKNISTSGSQLRAISAVDVDIRDFFNLNTLFDYMSIHVTDKSGMLILSNYYQGGYPHVDMFQNISLTGFNQSDFDILKTGDGQTCDLEIINTQCMYDVNHKQWNIKMDYIQTPDYYLIFMIESRVYTKDLTILLDNIDYFHDGIIRIISISILVIFISTIILFIFAVQTIQKPLLDLLFFTNKLIMSDRTLFDRHLLNLQSVKFKTIRKLNQSFIRLLIPNTRRTKDGSKIQYPQQIYNYKEIRQYLIKNRVFLYRYMDFRLNQVIDKKLFH